MNYDPIHDTYGPKAEEHEHLAERADTDSASQMELDTEPGTLPSNFRAVSKGFKHLKKADGEPFWRKDIQHDFLHELFTDQHRVFTNNFGFCEVPHAPNGPKLTFAELYVRTLAELLKLSRVLRERLIKDTEMGIAVSKVCLLVNAGRMNTTVNFVPDMRSALRTYHSIPSLQAVQDGSSKPLQDTPRLKTILKAVCDGQDHLQTLLDVIRTPASTKPNTNVIKLIFLMSTFFQNIPFHYEDLFEHDLFLEKLRFVKALPGPQNKFMEFFLNDEIHPKNRAHRFLWLMYSYLETLFTPAELEQNPFNPRLIPPLEYITPAEAATFDIDADYEVDYAVRMYHTRMGHLNDEVNNMNPKRGNKSKRERQKIRRQLILEHDYGLHLDGHDDTADELMLADDLNHDDHEALDEVEPLEEAPRTAPRDKHKRKKPTPSVGSLVDDSKKPLDAELRWENPEFPVKRLRTIRLRYALHTTDVPVGELTRDSAVAVYKKRGVVNKTKLFITQVAQIVPGFDDHRDEVLLWMQRYFQYKKATSNGLVGMEWEAIRSDLVHGVETYLYQQVGKALVVRHYDEQMEDERHESGEPELLKRESFVTGAEVLPGDMAPVDISAIDKLGGGYAAVHDFDHASERTTYEHELLAMVDDAMTQHMAFIVPRVDTMSFDLEEGTLLFARVAI